MEVIITLQDDIFLQSEGNAWFKRNRKGLDSQIRDYSSWIISQLRDLNEIKSVCDLGGANGHLLARLSEQFSTECQFYCVDSSQDALDDGKQRYPTIHFQHGTLNDIPVKNTTFDFVIVSFVLHWVDRRSLAKTISEIDRLVTDGGYLLLGDFLPDFQQRRIYHHYKDSLVYTYKQDYGRIFQDLGIYGEIARLTFNHDQPRVELGYAPSSSRGVFALLKKSYTQYYPET